jgi:Kef-type K+ transport system membrane component KefB
LVLLALARWVGKEESRQFVLLVAVVVLTIGIAHGLKLSVALALVVLGAFARNRDRAHALLPLRFGHGGQLFFVILFVLTGASLEFHALVPAAGAVTAFIGVRFLGKGLALALFGGPSGIDLRRASLLALALMPMSGLAVIMVRDTVSLYPAFGAELAAIVLSAVMVLELAGPVATQFALRRAGEARPGA